MFLKSEAQRLPCPCCCHCYRSDLSHSSLRSHCFRCSHCTLHLDQTHKHWSTRRPLVPTVTGFCRWLRATERMVYRSIDLELKVKKCLKTDIKETRKEYQVRSYRRSSTTVPFQPGQSMSTSRISSDHLRP